MSYDPDLAFGQRCEVRAFPVLQQRWPGLRMATPEEQYRGVDFVLGDMRLDLKTDRQHQYTRRFAIETHHVSATREWPSCMIGGGDTTHVLLACVKSGRALLVTPEKLLETAERWNQHPFACENERNGLRYTTHGVCVLAGIIATVALERLQLPTLEDA